MTYADENAHREPPIAGDETATLLDSLDRQRATLAWKTGGLDAAGLRETLGPEYARHVGHADLIRGVGGRAHR
ncbi:hypothetical protein ABZS77_26120 [Micromonospora sp. NPDC005298]|uniref:hypothetical protein n=1 Tax=Micromonospora sp. NPDC005298 TaxID=3156873 RepID=UPI0033ACD7B2